MAHWLASKGYGGEQIACASALLGIPRCMRLTPSPHYTSHAFLPQPALSLCSMRPHPSIAIAFHQV